jgi:hypothetical protein
VDIGLEIAYGGRAGVEVEGMYFTLAVGQRLACLLLICSIGNTCFLFIRITMGRMINAVWA